jgi:hypothetical protein
MVLGCLRDISTSLGEVLYKNPLTASDSGMIPWMIIPGKETRDQMKKFVPLMEREINEVEENPAEILLKCGHTITIKSQVDMTLVDGSAIKVASGLGGAPCVLCISPDKDLHDIKKVKDGFELDRDQEDTVAIATRLFDEDLGEIIRKRGDYEQRQGVTQVPLTTKPINRAPATLHKRLRALSWAEQFIYRVRAEVKLWKSGRLTQNQKDRIEKSRKEWLTAMAQETGLVLDTPTSKGGTTDTGNAAWRFFSPEVLPVLQRLLPDEDKEPVLQIHHALSVIFRVVTSTRRVDTVRLRNLCTDIYIFILTKYPWVNISQSLHEILGHSFQLIDLNDGFGLGQLIEQGSEGKMINIISVSLKLFFNCSFM